MSARLRKRGIAKAEANTRLIAEKGYYPDLIMTSSALRALQTAEVFAAALEPSFPAGEILQYRKLYLPAPSDIFEILGTVPPEFRDVFLFSHNNGISMFARHLCSSGAVIMPTGSVVRIEIDCEGWNELAPGCGRMTDFLP